MSIFTDGKEHIICQFSSSTENSISAGNTFLNTLNEVVGLITKFTGFRPGYHPKWTSSDRLIFQEVTSADPEFVNDEFAIWSPTARLIKINQSYIDKFISAANNSGAILELVDAIGTAALVYQWENPTTSKFADAKQIIANGTLGKGFARAVGLYPLKQINRISSIWSSTGSVNFSQAVSNELIRSYRKSRAGYLGDTIIGHNNIELADEPDIPYGFFVELFNVFGSWDKLGEWLSKDIPVKYSNADKYKLFSRTTLQQYDDLILDLSLLFNSNLSSLLQTWMFTRVDKLMLLDESLEEFDSTKPIVMSAKMRLQLDPEIVEREDRGAALPGIVLGGADSFGIGQSSGPVMVLLDPPPADGTSFKDLGAAILGCPESNGPIGQYTLSYNLGEVGESPVTLVVPQGLLSGWELKSYTSMNTASIDGNLPLYYAKVISLGEVPNPYVPVVERVTNGVVTTEEKPIPVNTYVIIAKSGSIYDYPRHNGLPLVEIITEETIPLDAYKDPQTGNSVQVPGGTSYTVRTFKTTATADGLSQKSETETTVYKDSSGTKKLELQKQPRQNIVDPVPGLFRERPLSESRDRADVLGKLNGHPLLVESVRTAVNISISASAVDNGLTAFTPGYRSEEQVYSEIKAQNPSIDIEVVNIPPATANTIKRIVQSIGTGNTPDEQVENTWLQVAQELGSLPPVTRQTLAGAAGNTTRPVVIPELEDIYFNASAEVLTKDQIISRSVYVDLFSQELLSQKAKFPNKSLRDQINDAQTIARTRKQELGALPKDTRTPQEKIASSNRTARDPVSSFINNGLAPSVVRSDNRADVFLSHLNGSMLKNVVQLSASAVPMFKSSNNPRALGNVISGVIAGVSESMGLPPGASRTIEQSLQDTFTDIALRDKPGGAILGDLVKNLALAVTETYFSNEQQQAASTVLDMVQDLFNDWVYNNSEARLIQDLDDVLKVTINSSDIISTLSKADKNSISGINRVRLMFNINETTDIKEPTISKLLHTPYGDFPIFDRNDETIYNLSQEDFTDNQKLDWWSKISDQLNFTKLSSSFFKTNKYIERLNKADKINSASLKNFQASLVQKVVVDEAYKAYRDQFTNNDPAKRTSSAALKTASEWLVKTSYFVKDNDPTSGYSVKVNENNPTKFKSQVSSLNTLKEELKKYRNDRDNYSPNIYPMEIIAVYDSLDTTTANRIRTSKYVTTGAQKKKLHLYNIFQNASGIPDKSSIKNDSLSDTDLKMSAVCQIKSSSHTYTFEIMPAVKSVAQTQGMQAPGADRGISWRSTLNIAKLNVPGSSPVYQIMGVGEEMIEFSGAFLGMRSQSEMDKENNSSQFEDININDPSLLNETTTPSTADYINTSLGQYFRAHQESEQLRSLQLQGSRLELIIKSYAGSDPNKHGINISVKGYIHQFQRFIKSDDRVWYQIMFRVTDHTNLSPLSHTGNIQVIPGASDRDNDSSGGLRSTAAPEPSVVNLGLKGEELYIAKLLENGINVTSAEAARVKVNGARLLSIRTAVKVAKNKNQKIKGTLAEVTTKSKIYANLTKKNKSAVDAAVSKPTQKTQKVKNN